jgi:low affinity Fe/Cu permease
LLRQRKTTSSPNIRYTRRSALAPGSVAIPKLEFFMNQAFSQIATWIAHQAGRPLTFLLAAMTIVVWAITGPIFHFSDTWQLIINTGTTIVTFLMVFVIQNTQNRDGAAIQAKLDELIRSSGAQNRFIGIEHLTDEEIEQYKKSCAALAAKAADRASKRAGESADRAVAEVTS